MSRDMRSVAPGPTVQNSRVPLYLRRTFLLGASPVWNPHGFPIVWHPPAATRLIWQPPGPAGPPVWSLPTWIPNLQKPPSPVPPSQLHGFATRWDERPSPPSHWGLGQDDDSYDISSIGYATDSVSGDTISLAFDNATGNFYDAGTASDLYLDSSDNITMDENAPGATLLTGDKIGQANNLVTAAQAGTYPAATSTPSASAQLVSAWTSIANAFKNLFTPSGTVTPTSATGPAPRVTYPTAASSASLAQLESYLPWIALGLGGVLVVRAIGGRR